MILLPSTVAFPSMATQLTEAEWLLHDHLTIAFHAAAPSLPQRFDFDKTTGFC